MKLRKYQLDAVNMSWDWLKKNKGNLCISLPTGAGKSHVIAQLCIDALKMVKDVDVLVLCGQKELIAQNAEKLKQHWYDAPIGLFSASLGKRQVRQITFAGIQSVWRHAEKIGPRRLVIVDEAHTISHKDQGIYRRFLNELKEMDPKMRIIGLTASPYRLGHGYITEGEAIFDDLIEPVGVKELIDAGFLSKLKSKNTAFHLEVEGVKKRGGEFIESQLQDAVNNDASNEPIIKEIMAQGEGRNSWLMFCTGVDHSYEIRDRLRLEGVSCETVTGKTPAKERDQILADFKAGKIKAVTNANVLTTGFDNPRIDLIALLRPTMSPGLYYQMVGRGLRIDPSKEDCKILDFAGAVAQHGPITDILPPEKKGEGTGEAPVKVCENCQEIVHLSAKECPACGSVFPEPEKPKAKLHDDDIMGMDKAKSMEIDAWHWHARKSKKGQMMLVAKYRKGLYASEQPVEYFCVGYDGFPGEKSRREVAVICQKSGVQFDVTGSHGRWFEIARKLNEANPPRFIRYEKSGKFFNIKGRAWTSQK